MPDVLPAKSILPKRNNLLVFPVSKRSHHRIAEVTGDFRISISGWYHFRDDDPKLAAEQEHEEAGPVEPPVLASGASADGGVAVSELLGQWVNPEYLKPETQEAVKKAFLEDSAASLENFFVKAKFDALERKLDGLSWQDHGPPNHHHYLTPRAPVPSPASTLLALMQSKEFADLLSSLTGLSLVQGQADLREFRPGHYTLLRDSMIGLAKLHATVGLTRDPTGWQPEWGGEQIFICGDDALHSEEPARNALSLVFADAKTVGFVKYLSSACPRARRDLHAIYCESKEDRENDDEDEDEDEEDEEGEEGEEGVEDE